MQEAAPRVRATRAVGRLLASVLTPAARRRGFAEMAVLQEWAVIVGPRLAQRSTPVKLAFKSRETRCGELVLRAGGGAALELQHAAPQIIERINDYCGFKAVGRLRLIQAPPPRRQCQAPVRPRVLSPQELATIDAHVSGIDDAGLREALASLGRSIQLRRRA